MPDAEQVFGWGIPRSLFIGDQTWVLVFFSPKFIVLSRDSVLKSISREILLEKSFTRISRNKRFSVRSFECRALIFVLRISRRIKIEGLIFLSPTFDFTELVEDVTVNVYILSEIFLMNPANRFLWNWKIILRFFSFTCLKIFTCNLTILLPTKIISDKMK